MGSLDDIGWKLLRLLQENARLSYREMGQRIGLSAPAVIERIRKMEDEGILTGYHAHVNLEKVGLPITAFVRLVTPRERSRAVGQILQKLPEVLECHRVTGHDSFILKVGVTSMPHLENFIDRLASYGQSATSIVLSSPVPLRILGEEVE
jgi:Lrp/AsnC family leucine-responsive transcriptional regulator